MAARAFAADAGRMEIQWREEVGRRCAKTLPRILQSSRLRAARSCVSVQLVAEPNIYDKQVGNVPRQLIPSLGP